MVFRYSFFGAALLCASVAQAESRPSYGAQLEGFDYPHPVQQFEFTSQQQDLSMAYMDVEPSGEANGRTAVLLHGKNFCAATWERTIEVLSEAGYRVIAPDQVGFCKSTKPRGYQFSFGQLAANTAKLLEHEDVEQAVIIGHSIGGMLAARFALDHADLTERLVMVNPIGLEDWLAKGVPYATIDSLYEGELQTDYERVKGYQQKFYYDGQWKPEYDRWVEMLAGMYSGPGREIVAWNQAQTAEMLFTQPVVQEFPNIKAPTLLLIGGKDRTAPGANRAPDDVARKLGDYPALGRETAEAIPDAELIEFPELGHSPQVEAPEEFHEALLKALANAP